jgi:RNA polymerase sigma-70 factor (ECF subfamily)
VLEAVETYELPLLRYARRLLDDLDLAHDAVQHAFVKLCEQSQDQLHGRVAPWLFRVCRNKAIDHLRQAGREQVLLNTADDTPAVAPPQDTREADPAELAEQHDLADLVGRLLAHLPVSQRETLDLWCSGLTYRQIAEVTGRSEGNVRVLAHRGLTRLRTHPQIQRLLENASTQQPARLP